MYWGVVTAETELLVTDELIFLNVRYYSAEDADFKNLGERTK